MNFIPIRIMSPLIYEEQLQDTIDIMNKIPLVSEDGYVVPVSEYTMIVYAILNNLSSN